MKMKMIWLLLLVMLAVLISLSSNVSAEEVIQRGADFTTIKENGVFKTTYQGDANMLKDGIYVPYDLTIKSSTDNYKYQMANDGEYSIYFRNNSNTAEPIRFEKDGYFFIYDISGSQMRWRGQTGFPDRTDTLGGGYPSNSQDTVVQVNDNKIIYAGAFTNTNVTYSIYKHMLKEEFILSGLPSFKAYNYLEYTGNVKFNRSLQICTDEKCFKPSGTQDDFNTSGKIYFKDMKNNTIFYLKEPIVRDSNGSEINATYFVKGSDAQMNFDLRINKTFLQNAVYPVYIDPTITYDFSASYQSYMNATEGEICTNDPTTSGYNPTCSDGVLSDITADTALDASDNSRENTYAGSSTTYGWIRFRANITSMNINREDITLINWTWEGYQDTGNAPVTIVFYNNSLGDWSSTCSSTTSGTDVLLSCFSSDVDGYINSTNNYTYFMAYLDGDVNDADFYTDFVKLEITYTDNPPTYSNFQNNATATKINGAVNWSINLADTVGLNHYFFAHNDSGTIRNVSNGTLSGTSKFINKTVTITKGRGNYICAQYTFNDTSNQFNQTLLTDSGACFTVNNTFPTMTSVELNKTSGVVDTDDLNCSAVGALDIDTEDTIAYHYEWYNNSIAKGYDTSYLRNNLTGAGTWYCEAWATDGYDNSSKYTSSSVIVGSSAVSPVIVTLNATTENTGINSTSINPTNNNSWINISIYSTDANGDARTAFFCTVNNFQNCQANASSEILCKSESNLTSDVLSCIFNVTGYTGANPLTFYGFVLDNSSLYSSGKSATFEINYPPSLPILIYPSLNSYININYTLINWTATDPNLDIINYTLYINSSTYNYTLFYNGIAQGFNFTNMTEYEIYNWRVYTFDEHGYGYHNVTLGNFTADWTKPNGTITAPLNGSTIYSKTFTLAHIASDNYLANCSIRVYQTSLGYGLAETGYDNLTVNCSEDKSITVTAWTDYTLDLYVYDLASNLNISTINFATAQPVSIPSEKGGGVTKKVAPERPVNETIKIIKEKSVQCGDGFCDDELGETPWGCREDCMRQLFNFDDILCMPLFNCGNWDKGWFINSVILITSGFLVYFFVLRKPGRLR